MNGFDWEARLDNWTDCEWVVAHRADYPPEATEAAEQFLETWPSLRAKEHAHNFWHVIEVEHGKAGKREEVGARG